MVLLSMAMMLAVTSGAGAFPEPLVILPLVMELVVNITEDDTPGTVLAAIQVYDKHHGDLASNLTFRIDKATDKKRQFSINDQGILQIARDLDRENIPRYELRIEAEDTAGNIGYNLVQIYLKDVNDNAPTLRPDRVPVVWENEPLPQLVAQVFGEDPDTPENGPPFRMSVPSDSKYLSHFDFNFKQDGDRGRGIMNISTKVEFHLEGNLGKVLHVPIRIRDSGTPIQEAIRYLPVIIGHKNHNPMFDGTRNIFVYNYKGQMPSSMIGSVYVSDADDWELSDKRFEWESGKPPGFRLESNGTMWMEAGTTGKHTLRVRVTDSSKNPMEEAIGTVHVEVEVVPEVAFLNSGSIRLRGTTAEDFIKVVAGSSPYTRLQKKLAEELKRPEKNVQIFSLMEHPGSLPPILDVRFAVHGSPYTPAVGLDGVVQQKRSSFESFLEVDIIQVNIDECLYEVCDGDCWTEETVAVEPRLIDSKQTALVGVTVQTRRRCQWAIPFFLLPNFQKFYY